MKKILALVIVILFAFAMTSVAFAYPPAEKAAPKAEEKMTEPAKAEKAKVKQITGEVAAIDAAAKSITVKGKKAEVIVAADEKMLADVKVGDKIVVKYTEKDGKNVAKSIKKAEASAEKKADESKAEPAKPAEPAKKKKAIEGC